MSPEEIKLLEESILLLKDSGMIEHLMKSTEPGGQTALIYSLIALVCMFAFRILVVDHISRKIISFHQESLQYKKEMKADFETGLEIFGKVETFLGSISDKLINIQDGQTRLYQILLGRRRNDKAIDFEGDR